MGDSFTRSRLLWDPDPRSSKFAQAKDSFLLALHCYLIDSKAKGKRKAKKDLYVLARMVDRTKDGPPAGSMSLARQLTEMLKALAASDKVMWLRLMLWVGRGQYMFERFQEISPLEGAKISGISNQGGSLIDMRGKLPSITQVVPAVSNAEELPLRYDRVVVVSSSNREAWLFIF